MASDRGQEKIIQIESGDETVVSKNLNIAQRASFRWPVSVDDGIEHRTKSTEHVMPRRFHFSDNTDPYTFRPDQHNIHSVIAVIAAKPLVQHFAKFRDGQSGDGKNR